MQAMPKHNQVLWEISRLHEYIAKIGLGAHQEMDGNYWGNTIQAFDDGDENPILPKVENEALDLEIRRPLVTFLSVKKSISFFDRIIWTLSALYFFFPFIFTSWRLSALYINFNFFLIAIGIFKKCIQKGLAHYILELWERRLSEVWFLSSHCSKFIF